MTPELLSKSNAPAGTRCLVQEPLYPWSPLTEVVVVEWSAGNRVKLRYLSGIETWPISLPYLIELLEPLPEEQP